MAFNKIATYLEMIKFQHSIFALPFAYLGAFLAENAGSGFCHASLDHAGNGRCTEFCHGNEPPNR